MNLIRQTIKLHTIDEWMSVDPAIRTEILRNIKIKDRLQRWLLAQQEKELKPLDDPRWVPCHECEQRGWVLQEPRYPGIHPSQIIHDCLLRIFWDMIGQSGKSSFEPRTLLIFDLGTAVHKMFQAYGARGAWGPHYTPEIEISAEKQELAARLMLEGHADADNILIIDDIPNAAIYEVGVVHEYKTINDNGFKKLTRPKPEHKQQACFYAAALNRPVVAYLYLNKNDSSLADFPVPFDLDHWRVMEAKAENLVGFHRRWEEAVAAGLPPESPPGSPGFHCKDCSHHKTCPAYSEHSKRRR